jgi:membrane dipeptidase
MREDANAPLDVDAYDLNKPTKGMTDIARLRKGMVGGQFWSVYIPGEIRDSGYARVQLEQIDIARRVIARYPKDLKWSLTAADVRAAHKAGKIGSLLGMEGGHAIENSLGALRAYYDLGAVHDLTHNVTLDWADAAADSARHGGLTAFGEEVVREMNRLGMLVDLSHVSPAHGARSGQRGSRDLRTPRLAPSPTCAERAGLVWPLPKNGGVVMMTSCRDSLRRPSPTAAPGHGDPRFHRGAIRQQRRAVQGGGGVAREEPDAAGHHQGCGRPHGSHPEGGRRRQHRHGR